MTFILRIRPKSKSIGIFIDLSNAFDIIDHSLLLKKLQHYGIPGLALDWFTSFLPNRHQYINIIDVECSMLPIKCWVPQGSILVPLLFILYINEIVNSSQLEIFIMFADDTHLFFKHKDLNTLYSIINTELHKIAHGLN